jgi:putative heme transporter
LIVALLASTLLVPPANYLRRRGLPSIAAAWIVLATSIAIMVGIVWLIAPAVADELDDLGSDVKRGTEDVLEWLAEGPLSLSEADVDRYIDQAADQLSENRESLATGVFRGAYLLVEAIAGLLLTFVLVFFFVKDGPKISNAIVDLFGEGRREDMREIGARSWAALGAYIRGTAVVGLVDAFFIGLALFIVGVPLVIPLAILTFFGAFFPLVGAVIAGILAALVALVSEGVVAALIIVAVTIAVQQIEGDVLAPLVLGRAVNLHPLVILLSLTTGAIVAGIAGAFLAVPVAAVATAIVSYIRSKRTPPPVEVAT